MRGTPDLLGVVNGYAIAIELKVDAPVEALQTHKMRKWENAGAHVFVVTPKNQFDVIDVLFKLSGF